MSDKQHHTHAHASVMPEQEQRDGHHGMHAEPAHEHDGHVPTRTAGEARPADSLAQDDIETNAMHAGHETPLSIRKPYRDCACSTRARSR